MPNTPTPTDKSGVDENVEEQKEMLLSNAKQFHRVSGVLLALSLKFFDAIRDGKAYEECYIVPLAQSANFFEAMCLELIIKVFWLLEKDTVLPRSLEIHDILKIFKKLDKGRQDCIKDIFHNDEQRRIGYESLRKSVKEGSDVGFPDEEDFEKVLSEYGRLIVDFRYRSPLLNGAAVPRGEFLRKLLVELEQKINPPAVDAQ